MSRKNSFSRNAVRKNKNLLNDKLLFDLLKLRSNIRAAKFMTKKLFNQMFIWPSDLLTKWIGHANYWLTYWFTVPVNWWGRCLSVSCVCLMTINWLTDWLTDWLTSWLTDCLIEWLAGWSTVWLTVLNNWLTQWINDRLADCTDQPNPLTDRSNDWLTDQWTDQLTYY